MSGPPVKPTTTQIVAWYVARALAALPLIGALTGCGEDENNNPTVNSIEIENPGNGEARPYHNVPATVRVYASDSDGSVASGTLSANGGASQPLSGSPLEATVTVPGESATLDAQVTDNEGASGSGSVTVPVNASEAQGDNDVIGAQIAAWQSASSIVAGWTNMDIALSGGGNQTLDGVIFDNNFTYRGIEYQGESQTQAQVDAIGTAVGADGVPTLLLYSDTLSNVQAALSGENPDTTGTVKSVAKAAKPISYDGPGAYQLPDADDSTWLEEEDGTRTYQSLLSNGALETITETNLDGNLFYVREVTFNDYILGRQQYEGDKLTGTQVLGALVEGTGAVLRVDQEDKAAKPTLTVVEPGTPTVPTTPSEPVYRPKEVLDEF